MFMLISVLYPNSIIAIPLCLNMSESGSHQHIKHVSILLCLTVINSVMKKTEKYMENATIQMVMGITIKVRDEFHKDMSYVKSDLRYLKIWFKHVKVHIFLINMMSVYIVWS